VGGACTLGGMATSYGAPLAIEAGPAFTLSLMGIGFLTACYGIVTWLRCREALKYEQAVNAVSETFYEHGKILTQPGIEILKENLAEADLAEVSQSVDAVRKNPELLEEKLGVLIR
ncbi:hypothetical protein KY329_01355, partial [Candidatus Woesearchaeota archaeon]|nr:hypothetical protein [Candidatus Woesearchaeota archaeon]